MQPRYLGQSDTFKNNAENKDIRNAIVVAVPKATKQMKQMAKRFKGANEIQTCQNIFNFLIHSIQYKADGENQIIKLPSALLHTKQGDCKSYSLFTAAVLNNLNIPCHFVLQSFSSDPTPSHIYCATDNGILIDAVYKQFNKEKTPTFKYNIPVMKVTHMSGIANSCTPVDGLGDDFKKAYNKSKAALKQAADFVGDKTKQAGNYLKEEIDDLNLKKYTLSIPRQIILGLFSLNVDGIATKVEKQNSKPQWERKWISFGGDPAALFRAIRDGASRREKKLGFLNKLKSWIQSKVGINGIGATQAQNEKVKKALAPGGVLNKQWEEIIYGGSAAISETISTTVGAPGAGTISSPVLSELILSNTGSIVDMLFPIDSAAAQTQGSGTSLNTQTQPTQQTQPNTPTQQTQSAMSNKNMLLIGGAILAAGAIIYTTNKKNE